MSSIFSKIIAGEIPGRFVWKDEKCVAFMDIMPVSEGHLLVVPRQETDRWHDLPPATAAHLFAVAHTIAAALDVSQDRDPGVLPTLLLQDVADAVRRDRFALPVRGALGNHQNRVASPGPPAPAEDIHHAVLPTVPGRGFRQEGVVRATRYGAHQRQVTAVASHHLDDEGSLV